MFGNRRYFRGLVAGSEEGIVSCILASRLKAARGHRTAHPRRAPAAGSGSLTMAGIQVPAVIAHGIWSVSVRSILRSKAVDGRTRRTLCRISECDA